MSARHVVINLVWIWRREPCAWLELDAERSSLCTSCLLRPVVGDVGVFTSQKLSLARVQEAPRSVTETRNVSDVTSVCIGFVTIVFFNLRKYCLYPGQASLFHGHQTQQEIQIATPRATSAWTVGEPCECRPLSAVFFCGRGRSA